MMKNLTSRLEIRINYYQRGSGSRNREILNVFRGTDTMASASLSVSEIHHMAWPCSLSDTRHTWTLFSVRQDRYHGSIATAPAHAAMQPKGSNPEFELNNCPMDGSVDRVSTKQEKRLHWDHGTVAFCRIWRGRCVELSKARQIAPSARNCALPFHCMQVCIAFAVVIGTCVLPNR
jgi:hypothetical protein